MVSKHCKTDFKCDLKRDFIPTRDVLRSCILIFFFYPGPRRFYIFSLKVFFFFTEALLDSKWCSFAHSDGYSRHLNQPYRWFHGVINLKHSPWKRRGDLQLASLFSLDFLPFLLTLFSKGFFFLELIVLSKSVKDINWMMSLILDEIFEKYIIAKQVSDTLVSA